jgi:hypothetical protein
MIPISRTYSGIEMYINAFAEHNIEINDVKINYYLNIAKTFIDCLGNSKNEIKNIFITINFNNTEDRIFFEMETKTKIKTEIFLSSRYVTITVSEAPEQLDKDLFSKEIVKKFSRAVLYLKNI